jgi:hypothetical protein
MQDFNPFQRERGAESMDTLIETLEAKAGT